jgi:rod shape-determining protein MreD
MRSAAYLLVAVLLLLVQANLHRVFGPIGGVIGERWLHGMTPDLALPLIVFLGVHEHSMARGALLSFGIGYAEDLLSGAPIGLLTFVSVAIWWLSRIVGVRLTAQTWLTRASLGFAFSLAQGALLLVLIAVFGNDNRRPVELASVVLPHALATALCSPVLFRLAQRLRQGPAPVRPAAEAAA